MFDVDADAASCQCFGLDYSDSGSYLIDASANGNFSFASQFQGNCSDGVVYPTFRDPDSNQYGCSTIHSAPVGSVQISTCGIPYSNLTTGTWSIVIYLPSHNTTITRTFQLTVGVPATVVTTVTPTVIIGTTSTAPDETTTTTARQTLNTTLPATTLTTPCSPQATSTTILRLPPNTIVQTSTVLQYTTDGTVTSSDTTTSTVTAVCRYPAATAKTTAKTTARTTAKTNAKTTSTVKTSTIKTSSVKPTTTPKTTAPPAITSAPKLPTGRFTFTTAGSICAVNPPFGAGGAGGGWRGGGGWGGGGGPPAWVTSMWGGAAGGALPSFVSCVKVGKRTAAVGGPAGVRIAAWTSTYVQTTFTATEVTTVYVPAATVTRYILDTVTQTITPPASIVCVNPPDATQTVSLPGANLTRITLETLATHVIETVFITQTYITIFNDMASATACWQNGGTYGV
ncbi:hypothetical protein B0H63DRAFT_523653 [Podospora didyma]|uniref:Uncharacterized protein n=1 Tax=Podospora didyma TaxID=330526 RepID=A0AAE0NG67_9PEZI|nr:hypothetical protein B0H63DRAFT_523653 [Podospora didyma]